MEQEEKPTSPTKELEATILPALAAVPTSPIARRAHHEEDFHDPNWALHRKHFFILSSSGRPIFSRYGDESKLSNVMGLLSAIISTVDLMSDTIRSAFAGDHLFVFLLRGHITLVCISRTLDTEKHILKQLDYLYSVIIGTLTSGINKIYESKKNYDIRSLLSGPTEKSMRSLLHQMNYDASIILNSIHMLRMPGELRRQIGKALTIPSNNNSIIFAVLVAKRKLVSYVGHSKNSLSPSDLQILMNFIYSTSAFHGGTEHQAPICLPQFNAKGFLWVYIMDILNSEMTLLLLSPKQDDFFLMTEARRDIVRVFNMQKLLHSIQPFLDRPAYSIKLTGVSSVRHFLYRSRVAPQFTCPAFELPYNTRKEAKRLLRSYQRIIEIAYSRTPQHKILFLLYESEAFISWLTPNYELYCVFPPYESKALCLKSANLLLSWLRAEEENLFALNLPVFS